MTEKIEKLIQRPQRSFLAGGVSEIVFGAFFVLMGGVFWASNSLPSRDFQTLGMFCVALCFLAVSFIQSLRNRFVLSRLGYAVPRQPPRWTRAIAPLALAAVGLLAILTHAGGVMMVGLFCAAQNLVFYAFARLPRFLVLAALNIAAAAVLAGLHPPHELALPLLFAIIGVTNILGGHNAMRSLLRLKPFNGLGVG